MLNPITAMSLRQVEARVMLRHRCRIAAVTDTILAPGRVKFASPRGLGDVSADRAQDVPRHGAQKFFSSMARRRALALGVWSLLGLATVVPRQTGRPQGPAVSRAACWSAPDAVHRVPTTGAGMSAALLRLRGAGEGDDASAGGRAAPRDYVYGTFWYGRSPALPPCTRARCPDPPAIGMPAARKHGRANTHTQPGAKRARF